MDEEKKPTVEETKSEPETQPKEEPKAEGEEKSTNEPQADEKGEGEKVPDEPEKPSKSESEDKTNTETAPPQLSEEDKLKEENFRLKTQLEAMKIGFNPDCIEDAVILAENIVKRDGSDISAALQAVAKKYPDWKIDEKGKTNGIKIGADSTKQKVNSEEKLNKAFGIKKG